MAKHYYPAVFSVEDIGYSVSVPDLPGCFTQGDSLEEAVAMSGEAIGLYLEGIAEADYPKASKPESIKLENPGFVMPIEFDKLAYDKKYNDRAVKKTLSIPMWLNQRAEEEHINFSKLLQSALKQKLQIS